MAVAGILTTSVSEQLRSGLRAIDGVVGVAIDEASSTIYLNCVPAAEDEPLEPRVRDQLLAVGVDPNAVHVEYLVRPDHGTRSRVRFVGVEHSAGPAGTVTILVTLEWQGREIVGKSSGEATETIALRAAANATIQAVAALLGSEIGLRLTGIKQIRAFDAELIITSVHRTSPPVLHYVGAAIVRGDPLQSACRSTLHALNRMMGNFLATSD